jgi:hypothetical protein
MNKLTSALFPSGKTNKHYLNYIKYSFISNTAISVQNSIAVQSMLSVITAEPELANINYIGKDIIGQLGSLIYMTKYTNKIDSKPKTFLNQSHFIQQTSYFLLYYSSIIQPDYFIFVAGASNILSNVSFIGYGAINAKCIEKVSDGKNIGQIYTKLTCVNTLASTIGLGIGVYLNMYIENDFKMLLLPLCGVIRIIYFNKSISGLIK